MLYLLAGVYVLGWVVSVFVLRSVLTEWPDQQEPSPLEAWEWPQVIGIAMLWPIGLFMVSGRYINVRWRERRR